MSEPFATVVNHADPDGPSVLLAGMHAPFFTTETAERVATAINTAHSRALAEAVGAAVGPLRHALSAAEWGASRPCGDEWPPIVGSLPACPVCSHFRDAESTASTARALGRFHFYEARRGHRLDCALAAALRAAT